MLSVNRENLIILVNVNAARLMNFKSINYTYPRSFYILVNGITQKTMMCYK